MDRPEEEPILVALDRLRRCPQELSDEFWLPGRAKQKSKTASTTPTTRRDVEVPSVQAPGDDTWPVNQERSVGGAENSWGSI